MCLNFCNDVIIVCCFLKFKEKYLTSLFIYEKKQCYNILNNVPLILSFIIVQDAPVWIEMPLFLLLLM